MDSTNQDLIPKSLSNVKHIILIMSGKGGVGKSSIATQLALSLAGEHNLKVGVLDIDLTGPSIPRMFGLENKQVLQSTKGWLPVKLPNNGNKGSIKVMSLGFLLNNRGNSVVWRGPKKTAMIKQFISDVYWGDADDGLDYLLIDTPPGTTDEHISIVEELRFFQSVVDGAIVVTTPQNVAISDVRKQINFCKAVDLKIIGIIENMSGFVCPYCEECTDIFSSGGGSALAKNLNIRYLGDIPIDPKFVELIETQSCNQDNTKNEKENGGPNLINEYKKLTTLSRIFSKITCEIINYPPKK
ncbi:iron-sulfur cluster assembly protein CFD1 SCDLUD_005154 [Saccharomycodes ludwigii]|uniref:iron-sulfur cluster assembly protein CFD1 n=1 Tax=Saccharomycodes ludwigii TaxID=36035 RepID=UPI001E82B7E9|nr:hypothetical protein SCDLUD_005154 [Saccharomycodes ludwigii]KAH3898816.1 hypothetical protein SCDLUD_005154 [Saccharomycodes ludwigii]